MKKATVKLEAAKGMKVVLEAPAPRRSNPIPIKNVSIKQVQAVVRFLPIFEKIDPDDFAHMNPPPVVRDGTIILGHLEYHRAVDDFTRACYENGFVQGFDWVSWHYAARQYVKNPALIASARLATCIKLLTAHVRAERFCDGHLEDVLRSGHLIAVLRRLQKLGEGSTFRICGGGKGGRSREGKSTSRGHENARGSEESRA